jgi:hypothetical protein
MKFNDNIKTKPSVCFQIKFVNIERTKKKINTHEQNAIKSLYDVSFKIFLTYFYQDDVFFFLNNSHFVAPVFAIILCNAQTLQKEVLGQ